MEHTARISKSYRWRLLLIGLMIFGYGGCMFLYDGFIGYPKKNEVRRQQIAKFNEYKEKGDLAGWEDHAREQGWSTDEPKANQDDPEMPVHNHTDLLAQKIIGFICAPLGLWFLWGWVASGSRYVVLKDGVLSTNKGESVALDDITRLDDTRWKKGIALVHYQSNGDSPGAILLDDWKFDCEPTRAIHEIVKEHVDGPMDVGDTTTSFGEDEPAADGESVTETDATEDEGVTDESKV